ncbi:uncharacterized protein F5147DRAFT_670401 [Suillus discolor]|uniref:Uncharacterized protein n=1 Tax=Suillus discolor TaxID=1912936 RepID=A0A9P7FHW5_9AGAM|nr:uncharacterized protein F5147DRAFT_670401 [Suillus discolor]KAG2118195.1 hypothetical protein F5147DRAFT_670401 [Suillus discolor]
MHHQSFLSGHFPGVMTSNVTYTSYQPYLHQQHGAGLVTSSASPILPQAPSLSVGDKRVAEDLRNRNVRRIKKRSGRIEEDPLFEPMLDQHGRHDGRYVCSKDGKLVRPSSYKRHIKTEKHLGYKPVASVLPPSEGQDIALAEVHDTLAADAMQEPPLVTPVLPPSEVREITLAEVRGCIPFWRWINDTEGLVDPLPPIAEPPSSRLPEATLADAAEDPDI